jgi:hypothetical protein
MLENCGTDGPFPLRSAQARIADMEVVMELTPEQRTKMEKLLKEMWQEGYTQGYSDGFNEGNTPRIEPDEKRPSAGPSW